jgi:hypothetical protein
MAGRQGYGRFKGLRVDEFRDVKCDFIECLKLDKERLSYLRMILAP